MNETTGYILSGLLVLLVFTQLRWHQLRARDLIRPIVIITVVVFTYLKTIPTAGNDVTLELLGAGAGAALGIGCAFATEMRRGKNGKTEFKANAVAATLWIVGALSRSAFSIYANNGGGKHIEHFSIAHQITSDDAWAAALILMAIVEVVTRTTFLLVRSHRTATATPEYAEVAEAREPQLV